jgi:hypothetical protein
LLQENTIHNAISRNENLHAVGRAALLRKIQIYVGAMSVTIRKAHHDPCGSWLASDSGRSFNKVVDCPAVIAGKPAPTGGL